MNYSNVKLLSATLFDYFDFADDKNSNKFPTNKSKKDK